MKKLEDAIREAILAVQDKETDWHADVLYDGKEIKLRGPIRGAFVSQEEREGTETLLVSIEGWDSEALADYDGCETEEEQEQERFNAEQDLFNQIYYAALEQANAAIKEK